MVNIHIYIHFKKMSLIFNSRKKMISTKKKEIVGHNIR